MWKTDQDSHFNCHDRYKRKMMCIKDMTYAEVIYWKKRRENI